MSFRALQWIAFLLLFALVLTVSLGLLPGSG